MKFAAALALFLAAPLAAQVRESVTVELIEVPVYVVDRDGAPIRNLPREAFELYVDGKRQPLGYFDTIDFAAPAPLTAAVRPARERRLYLFVFDLCYTSLARLARARAAAVKAVDEAPESDLFAVASYDQTKGVQLLTSFLHDRAAIHHAVATLRASDADVLSAGVSPDVHEQYSASSGLVQKNDRGAEAEAEIAAALMGGEANRDTIGEEARRLAEAQLDGLSGVVNRLAALEGQKHVVIFSEGFHPSFLIDNRSMRVQWAMKAMRRAFAAAGAFLDTVDTAGIRYTSSPVVESNDALRIIAHGTNGEFVHNRNDLTEGLRVLTAAHEVVYVLGFQRSGNRAGTIDVRVKDLPRGARVTFRPGFGAPVLRKDVDPLQLADILLNDLPQSGVTLHAEVAGKEVAVSFPGNELEPGATAEVLLYVFDGEGAVAAFRSRQFPITADASAVTWRESFDLPPGTYAAKALLHVTGTSTLGFVRRDFTVR
jgi:VWFA-related protein